MFLDIGPSLRTASLAQCRAGFDCVLASHLFGIPSLREEDVRCLQERGIPLVEDCAQTVVGSVGNLSVGSLGDAAVYSFNGSKHLPAGEGGMVATNDASLAEHIDNFVMTVATPRQATIRRFNDASAGWNYRLGSLTASLAEALIWSLPSRIDAALHAHLPLRDTLRGCRWLQILGEPFPDQFAPLGCPVLLRQAIPGLSLAESRAVLYFALRDAGIPVSVWVPDPAPATWLVKGFYENAHITPPESSAYRVARTIADGHVVFATNRYAAEDYTAKGLLASVLDAFESQFLAAGGLPDEALGAG